MRSRSGLLAAALMAAACLPVVGDTIAHAAGLDTKPAGGSRKKPSSKDRSTDEAKARIAAAEAKRARRAARNIGGGAHE